MDSTTIHTLTIPDIDVSFEKEWGELNYTHQKEEQQSSDSDSDSITTGISRTLSLRRLSHSSIEKDSLVTEVINIATTNPSHLFWVPASQHPEIAPHEFEKYVKQNGLLAKAKNIKRRQSVLSVYFTANDQLKLDELAKNEDKPPSKSSQFLSVDESSESEDTTADEIRRKLLVRRSVSLSLPKDTDPKRVPEFLIFDRNSSPLDESRALVPKADRPLLRRGARNNFKRNSSTGPHQKHHKDDQTEDREGQTIPVIHHNKASSLEGVTLTDSIEDNEPPDIQLPDESAEYSEYTPDQVDHPVLHAGHHIPPITLTQSTIDNNKLEEVKELNVNNRNVVEPTLSKSASTIRKSHWSWAFWSDERSSRKNNQHSDSIIVDETNLVPPNEREMTSLDNVLQSTKSSESLISSSGSKRFTFSSLFSRKSKQNNETKANITSQHLTTAPKDFQLNRMYMTRLPLHVERAIYRLSHIKLANPRRPLKEQVLISNLMFWYLSIIATNNPSDNQSIIPFQPKIQHKKPRKLVKKQRSSPQITLNNDSNQGTKSSKLHNGTVKSYMKTSSAESTGFVVPENYLNPRPQSKKRPTKDKKPYSRHEWEDKNSDTSSDEDEEEEEGMDDEHQDDDVPLGLYKTHKTK
ncbi:hypothetical protein BDB01DRAFT_832826 [Pilobolus umbonatus]|nr:hypothetical protein BDB01DRAFT_832826 [Pilobolus umbonatus]